MFNILFLIEQKAVKPANTNWFFRWHRLTDLNQFRHGRAHRQTITGNRQETQGWLLESALEGEPPGEPKGPGVFGLIPPACKRLATGNRLARTRQPAFSGFARGRYVSKRDSLPLQWWPLRNAEMIGSGLTHLRLFGIVPS